MNVAEIDMVDRQLLGDEEVQVRVWDPVRVGRIIEGARHRAGYARIADLVVDLERRTGVRRHTNTLYDVVNGKRLPDLELMTALMITLKIPHREMAEGVCEEFRESFRALHSQ